MPKPSRLSSRLSGSRLTSAGKLSQRFGKQEPISAAPSRVRRPPTPEEKKFPFRLAIVFVISHVIFAILISLWGFHISIFQPHSADVLLYIMELPGVELAKGIDYANIEEEISFILAFFVNTIFYALVGFALGHVALYFQVKEDIDELFLTEAEIKEKDSPDLPLGDLGPEEDL